MTNACKEMGIKLDLIAINHWPVAISSHQANHPYAQHLCTTLDNVEPRKLVPGGRLNLLVASPECTHHSNARGGRPMSDQSRASAWCILRWAEALYIDNILIENVKEFRSWGPLGASGRPIKKLKGQLFHQFIESLRALGYKVEHKILNAADYGDPTTRQRLFVIARRGNKKVVWPAASHCNPVLLKKRSEHLFGAAALTPWVAARSIIDWSIPGKSIFGRKKPLAKKTLERIYAGLERFGGPNAEPYLIILRQHMAAQSLDQPLSTLTAGENHVGLVEPFVFAHQRKQNATSVDEPISTLTAQSSDFALVEPFLISRGGPEGAGRQPKSIDEPLGTVMTENHRAIVEPFILPHDMFEQSPVDSIDVPLRTLVGKNARQVRVCEPVLVPFFGERDGQKPRSHSIDEPLATVTGHGAGALVEPFLLDINHGRKEGEDAHKEGRRRAHSLESPLGTVTTNRSKALIEPFMMNIDHRGTKSAPVHSVDAPLSTQTTKARSAVVEPCIVKYYGTAKAQSIDKPLHTVTTKDRYALVTVGDITYALDIRLRMLQTHELAAAMSMGGYKFSGKAEEQVKQIGNAVPVLTAQALCRELLQ